MKAHGSAAVALTYGYENGRLGEISVTEQDGECMSRTDNSLKNLKTAVLFKLAAIVVNFIARKIFVVVLTQEYLGLDGTFANNINI